MRTKRTEQTFELGVLTIRGYAGRNFSTDEFECLWSDVRRQRARDLPKVWKRADGVLRILVAAGVLKHLGRGWYVEIIAPPKPQEPAAPCTLDDVRKMLKDEYGIYLTIAKRT